MRLISSRIAGLLGCCLLSLLLHPSLAAAQEQPAAPSTAEDISKLTADVTTAREIQGMSLWDRENALLGEVADVILDKRTSRLRLVLVSQGGFLGIGTKDVAIDWREIEYDPQARLLRTRKLTEEDLKEREPYEARQTDISISDWR
ncbi:PRC-barrel domain-containing protein [Pelagibius sp.]|uniref:PRC-barrel domain-containing protein n=1 Tax=Pelagibius sp. TaxID=1931238 RepID=UPI00262F92FA|nr:PRC-barrel domain-containing protein [Pelagibius sp.]